MNKKNLAISMAVLSCITLLFPFNPEPASAQSQTAFAGDQQYLFDIFQSRRSVRNFRPDPVPREHILKILDIARTAPTAGNQQPWKFLVIEDREKIDRLKAACVELSLKRARQRGISEQAELDRLQKRMGKSYSGYLSAPVFIVVLTDSKSRYPDYNEKDGVLAGGYLLIAARSLGYGTVFTTDSFPEEVVREVFEIPERFRQVCFIPVGVPEEWPDPPEKKPLEAFVVFEKFAEDNPEEKAVEKNEIQLDKDVLMQYTGKYDYQGQLTITITLENGKLFMESGGQQKVELFAESKTRFFLKVADASVTFVRNDEGRVVELIAHQQGQDFKAVKAD
jgi:nitroreductase